MSEDYIDREFADLVSQLGAPDDNAIDEDAAAVAAEGVPAPEVPVEKDVDDMDAPPLEKSPDDIDLDAPEDESLHLDGGKLSVALVLAPVASTQGLHAMLKLLGVEHDVVRLKPWTAVYLKVHAAATDEDEYEALLSDSRPMPDEVDHVARVLSKLSKYGSVAMVSWLVEGDGIDAEPGVSGQITARRFVSGEPEDDIPAGVLLGTLPAAAEDLLLGRTKPEDYKDSVAADGTPPPRKPGPFGRFGFGRKK